MLCKRRPQAALEVVDLNEAEEDLFAVLESVQKNPAWKTSAERPYAQPRLETLAEIATSDVLERVTTLLAGLAHLRERGGVSGRSRAST